MLLTGTYSRTLDDKKRLTLPKRVREQLGQVGDSSQRSESGGLGGLDVLFVSPGPDQCLWLYTQAGLEGLAEKLDQSPATGAEAMVFRRLYFAQTESVEVDRAGRILIPERLVQLGALKHEVTLIGVRDHLELWDAERWQQYLAQNAPRFDAVAEGAFRK
jgi:MraZ protein